MNRCLPLTLLLLILGSPLGYLGALWVGSTEVKLQILDQTQVIGESTRIHVLAIGGHGVREFEARLEQGEARYILSKHEQAAKRWSLFRPVESQRTFEFDAGSKAAPGLKDGRARLVIAALSNDLRARETSVALELQVNTKPPGVSVEDIPRNFTLGGTGVVAFTASGYWTEAGVRLGRYNFRSFPMPKAGTPNRRICFFAIPYDIQEGDQPVVFERNPSGAEAVTSFRQRIHWRKFRHRRIDLTDSFLNKVLRELDPGGAGRDPLVRFVKINNDMRQADGQRVQGLREKSADHPLWNGPFRRLAGVAVEAQFCDYREYVKNGVRVDEQVHLGYDLASTKHAPVRAANEGRVVHAGPLGIYGNTVVIDHGVGVQSLYAHLSEILVKADDVVTREQRVGLTGTSGLAGGDHLHFTMLVEGIPVDSKEWWDARWLENRILSQMQ
ncbi:MAG: M23 family metallopeptidase [Candidatus Solibacter usitatus]|nr:M23 family metallopeptidase [Candidatus Solibacter usitatus]